ncbi:hypothetical protein GQ54DRAFT_178280 [Martensiomyces pterosporus]|nr:hypothetical protein GQ54DRAFT_178280 [Martensiomyces pterosporus]
MDILDIDTLYTDYVKEAQRIAGSDTSDTTRRLFAAATSIAAEHTDGHVVFLELYPRDHLLECIQEDAADKATLRRITIRYMSTVDEFKALMAVWHCSLPATGSSAGGALKEQDFLVWEEEASAKKEPRNPQLPDCLFIDGIEAIPSEHRQLLLALVSNTMDCINRCRKQQGRAPCQLILGSDQTQAADGEED